MQISWSLLCCTILQAAYYVDTLVITLLHNIVDSILCRYLDHYFSAQYCKQRTRQISWSLLYCTILQAAYYVDILVITLLHNTVGSVLFTNLDHYFAAQYCSSVLCRYLGQLLCCCTIMQAAYYVDILVNILLHNTVGNVLCRYLGCYFTALYCRQRTMQIPWSLLCCTILQAAYQVDILVITLLHNIVGNVLCRYLVHYFAAQYCRLRTMQILGHYFAAKYCRQLTMQISCSLLFCTILQVAYYVDMLVVTLLHNIVGSVLCRYRSHYFAAQYCRQRSMQISWSLFCCTILQAVYYVDILVISLLHNIVGSVLCGYLDHYFAAQYCRQRTMQISQPLLCRTIMQAAYYVDILVITLLHYIVGRVLCIYLVNSVICRYLGRYFVAQYCKQRSMQISCSLLYCTILFVVYYVDILVVTLPYNTVRSVLCRYLGR